MMSQFEQAMARRHNGENIGTGFMSFMMLGVHGDAGELERSRVRLPGGPPLAEPRERADQVQARRRAAELEGRVHRPEWLGREPHGGGVVARDASPPERPRRAAALRRPPEGAPARSERGARHRQPARVRGDGARLDG